MLVNRQKPDRPVYCVHKSSAASPNSPPNPASSGQSCLNKSCKELSWSGARRQGMTSWSVGEFKCQVGVSRSSAWIMWHKCIHMRAEARGEESLPWPATGSALWECKPSRWTPLICVDCHWWPTGKCFLIAKRSINCFIGAENEVRTTQYIWFRFYFLPSCLSFVKNAAEIAPGSAAKHGSTAARRGFYCNMDRLGPVSGVWNIAGAEIKDFNRFSVKAQSIKVSDKHFLSPQWAKSEMM